MLNASVRARTGYITTDELTKVLEEVGTSSPQEIKDILANVDKNQDGSIDYAEFVEMMKPPTDGPVRRRKDKEIKF